MEGDRPREDLSWIDVGYGDLFDDCPGSNKSNQHEVANQRRAPCAGLLKQWLLQASACGDAARVAELLRGGYAGTQWPTPTLQDALKHAADAATVAAFASVQPEFFHSAEGASVSIFLALKTGNEKTMRLLLAAGVSPEVKPVEESHGAPLLHWACGLDSPDAIHALLAAGADVTARDAYGFTALHIAANMGHTACVEALLSAGTKVDLKTEEGWTALHHASGAGRASCVRVLLEAGAAADARGGDGRSPLHLVCRGFHALYLPDDLYFYYSDDQEEDYAKCCQLLLAHGLDACSVDEEGLSPLYHAMSNRNAAVLSVLGRAGADLSQKLNTGETALHAASSCSDFEDIVEDLVSLGLDINARTIVGWTPLHHAVAKSCLGTVEVLLRRGADISIESASGESPLFTAVSYGFADGLQAMLNAGGDPRVRRASDGKTLLHAAASSSREAMEVLLKAGADDLLNARDVNGCTPLHFAVHSPHILDYLLQLGVDLQARDNRGWSAIHFAASELYIDSLHWLSARANSDEALRDALGVSARAADGATPLHLAASASAPYVVQMLLQWGASAADVDSQGRTALHMAARRFCDVTLSTLLESSRGGDRIRGIRDINGDTAAQVAELAMIRRMLEWWCVAA